MLKDENNFIKFYHEVRQHIKVLLNLNEIKHGDLFYNDDYNGYDLSYLAVRYLSELLSDYQIEQLLYDFDKIKEIGNDVVFKLFEYYDENI